MQRTKDVPLALQYENTSPMEYFQRLISSFENKMQTYRQQIKMLEKHLGSITQPSGLTPQELVLAIKKFHETFVFLAAELQTIHETVAVRNVWLPPCFNSIHLTLSTLVDVAFFNDISSL